MIPFDTKIIEEKHEVMAEATLVKIAGFPEGELRLGPFLLKPIPDVYN